MWARRLRWPVVFAVLATVLVLVLRSREPGRLPPAEPLVLPDVVDAIYMEDDLWIFGPVEEVKAHWAVRATAEGYRGEASFYARQGFMGCEEGPSPLTATEPITIPTEVVRAFLGQLSSAPLTREMPAPTPWMTDVYPRRRIQLDWAGASVAFVSTSQQEDTVPWSVETTAGTFYVGEWTPERALATLQPYLKQDILDKLVEDVCVE